MDELTYEQFQAAIRNLILNALQIYDITFNKIKVSKEENSKNDISKYLEKLSYLKKKEKNILNYIFENNHRYDEDIYLNENLLKYIEDDYIRSLIYTRLENCFLEKQEEYFENLTEEDYEYDDEYDEEEIKYEIENNNYEKVFNYLNLEYLATSTSKNEDIEKEKYILSFTESKIEDELLIVNYQFENLITLPININAQIIGIDEETYINYEKEICLETAMNILNQIEDNLHINENSVLNMFEFFCEKMDPNDLQNIKEFCVYKKEIINDVFVKEIIIKMIKIINTIMSKVSANNMQTVITEELEENEDTTSFTEKEVDILFELMKTENKIYDLINNLYILESHNKKDNSLYNANFEILKKLKIKEEQLISEISLNTNLKIALEDLIDNYLNIFSDEKIVKKYENIFSENQEKINIIKKRLENILNENDNDKISLYIDEKLPTIVENEQYLEALKTYNKYIVIKKNKRPWVKIKYQKIFENDFLLKEFLENNGDLSKNTWYSEELMCELLGITINEYRGDKQQILFELAENVIVDIYLYATKERITEKELAETKYNMFLLKLITKNLDKELIEQLENDSQYTDENFKFKNEMIKIFNKNKIKQVTNKK